MLGTGAAAVAIGALSRPAGSVEAGSPFFGVTSHFLHYNRFLPGEGAFWRLDNTLPVLKELGSGTVHEAVYAWSAPHNALVTGASRDLAIRRSVRLNREEVSDWFKLYDRAGMEVVVGAFAISPTVPLAAENNAEFAAWMADLVAAHPSIVAIQLHNEPNLPFFWQGTPGDYVRTFRPLVEAVRAKKRDIRIYGGAVSSLWFPQAVDWLKGAVAAGLLEFVDGIAVHPYNNTARPESDPHFTGAAAGDPDGREKALHAYWRLLSDLNTAKRPLDLVFTEFGYSTGKGLFAVPDETVQADYLSRSLMIYMDARVTGVPIRAVYWYDLKDDGQDDSNLQHRFGLVTYDLSRRKPAFAAFKAIAAAFPRVDDLQPAAELARTSAPGSKLKTWRRKSDGATIVAFWSLLPPGAPEAPDAIITLPGARAGEARLQAADGRPAAEIVLGREADRTVATVRPRTRAQWLVVPAP